MLRQEDKQPIEETPWWQDGPILFAILWVPFLFVILGVIAGITALLGR